MTTLPHRATPHLTLPLPHLPTRSLFSLTNPPSVYSTQGCNADKIFQLPDTFKAFIQTDLLTSYCSSKGYTDNSFAQIIAPYNTNAIGQITCPNTVQFAFSSKFDGACVVGSNVGTTAVRDACYGPYKGGTPNPIAGNANIQLTPGTTPVFSSTFSLKGSNCRNTCMKIYPQCSRPTGQPTSQPSSEWL